MTAAMMLAVSLVSTGAPKGEWRYITAEGFQTNAPAQAAAFSREVVNAADVTKAEAFVTALGCFELYVNGRLVSVSSDSNRADYLRPGYTDRVKRRVSLGYDVTDLWRTGKGVTNALSAFVAQSWYGDRLGRFLWMKDLVPPSLAAQVRLRYADGKTAVVETDGRWSASFATPFVRAGIYEGETYDARSNACARTCAGTRRAVAEDRTKAAVTPYVGAGISLREDLTLRPVAAYAYAGAEGAVSTNAFGRVKVLRRYAPGQAMTLAKGETLVIDFGQNAAAIPEIVATAARGTTLRFKGVEMLNDANGEVSRGCDGPAGSPYFANYRSLKGWDWASVAYVFAGEGEERYRPTFTFLGYRYGVLTATDDVTIRSVVSVPVTSIAKRDERGTLKTGDKCVNRLIENIRWGQYSNYVSVPTDCPQRDERLGWTADTQVFTRAAFCNADVCDFLRKWTGDLRDGQGADGAFPSFAPGRASRSELGWADAGVIVPWTAWRMTGRTEIIYENWEAMNRYLDSIASDNAVFPGVWTFADWLSFEKWESNSGACLESNDGKGNCWPWPGAKRMWDFLYGCYWLTDAEKMAEMAVATGRDPARYQKMAERARNRLKLGFFEADGGLLREFRDMQTPALFALWAGLYRDEQAKQDAVKGLMENFRAHGDCLRTGFLGTSIIMDALTSGAGRPEMAYALLLQHGFPSWLYSVDQGATTVWERWNSYTKRDGFGPVGMNSFNHYAYGCVLSWMYGTMAGIQPGPKGGFDGEFRLAPVPDARMGFVEATYRTRNGVIRSAWKYEGGRCRWRFTVPDGSRATVVVKGVEKVYGAGEYELPL